jgi:tripartite-type tricarboxylate transporter receptor subunit TctC
MARVLALPEVRERLATLGAEPAFMGPEEFAAFASKYVAETRKLGEQIGIKAQ